MEITCTRCHQAVADENCFCPNCGLPQLVYTAEESSDPAHAERWNEAVRDASSVEWRPALRAAMLLAVPAGLLSCGLSPVGLLGLFWMAAAAAWAVTLYVRRQRPAWITIGAGARIGLVTGLLAGWLAFLTTGVTLYSMRFFFHQGQMLDEVWKGMVDQSMHQQFQAVSADAQASSAVRALLLTPEGRAGSMLAGLAFLELALLGFAAAGGALSARLLARTRRPEV